jgi:tetratricopeptide (TPR) repeat protein
LLLSERRLPEADAALQAAIERSPEWWVPYRTRAKVLVARGDLPGAKALLVEALGKVKEPNLIRLEQAQLLSATGDHDGAITIYESMLKATPGELTVANNLAYALATYRSDAASLARAGQVAAPLAASSNARYLDTYGWVKLKQGDAPAAIAVLEKAIATLPLPEFKYHLALAALASGQRDRAKTLLGEALDKSAPFPGRDDAEAQLAKLHKGA